MPDETPRKNPVLNVFQGFGVFAAIVAILLGSVFIVIAVLTLIASFQAESPKLNMKTGAIIAGVFCAIGGVAIYMGLRILRRPRIQAGDVLAESPPQLRANAIRSWVAGLVGVAGGLLNQGGLRWFLLVCGAVSILTGVLMLTASRRRGF